MCQHHFNSETTIHSSKMNRISNIKKAIWQRMSSKVNRKQRKNKPRKSVCERYHCRDFLDKDRSFRVFLSDQCGRELFMKFLVSEFSEENFEFWIACEELSNIADHDDNIPHMAHSIYTTYVEPGCSKEINLNSCTRQDVSENLDNPTKTMFAAAQKRIESLMEKDSFDRFVEKQVCLQPCCLSLHHEE